jgi:hypothetical protein
MQKRRSVPHRLERCGYSPVRNHTATDGYWLINGTRQPIYAKTTLMGEDRLRAAMELIEKLGR